MKGSELKYLAGVANLARLDFEAASLTLSSRDGVMTAVYGGTYSHGWRRLAAEDVPDFSISLSASQFRAMTALIDAGANLSFSRTPTMLRVRDGRSRIDFRAWGEPHQPEKIRSREVEWACQLESNKLLAEASAAAAFVAGDMHRPILTGIRLEVLDPPIEGESPGLQFTAFNGYGALFQSTVNTPARGRGVVVVPTQDFLLGLQLMGSGDVTLARTTGRNNIVLYNDHALFRSSIIAGVWPDTDRITSIRNRGTLHLSAGQVKAITGSVKALKAAPEVEVGARGASVVFSVTGDGGNFAVATPGKLPKRDLRYDSETLALVASLGDDLSLSLPEEPDMPTVVSVNGRRAWIISRV